jgi:hypothetical protein
MFRTSRGNSDHIEDAFPKACSSVVKARRRESKSVPRCFAAERRQEDYGYLDRGLPVCSWPGRLPLLLELPVLANPESHRAPASRYSCCWIRKPPPTRHRSNSPLPCQCYLRHRMPLRQRRPNHRRRLETWPSSAKHETRRQKWSELSWISELPFTVDGGVNRTTRSAFLSLDDCYGAAFVAVVPVSTWTALRWPQER